jgi:hypothetical protein
MEFNKISPLANNPNPENKKSSKKEAVVTNTQIGVLRSALDSTIQRLGTVYGLVKGSEKTFIKNPKMNRRKILQYIPATSLAAAEIVIKKTLKRNDT